MTTPQPFPTPTRRSPEAPPGDELAALRSQVQALAAQATPRHSRLPPSVRRVAENRWTPAAITALIAVVVPLAVAWTTRTSDYVAREVMATSAKVTKFEGDVEELQKALKAAAEREAAAQEATRLRFGAIQDELGKAATKAAERSNWEDVAWCAVGVKSPSGCADVELLPRPMRGSTAPPIQVRARAPPN